MGGAYEWSFMLLLGANEDDLEGRLDAAQKYLGLKILLELQKNGDLMKDVKVFQELCEKLEASLASLKVELENLMQSQTLSWLV